MPVDYEKLYFHLAGKISDMIDLTDLIGNPPEEVLKQVREGLIRAVQEAEEEYLERETDPLVCQGLRGDSTRGGMRPLFGH